MSSSTLLSDPTWRQLLSVSQQSTQVFSTTFLSETFDRPFSPGAKEIFQAIDSGHQKVLILAHRGLGKTSIASRAVPAKNIVFKESKFTVLVSATASSAEMNAMNLQSEFVNNTMIKTVFGDLKSAEMWSKQGFMAGDTYVLPRGSGQQIRGLNFMGRRPDRIIVDDLETAEGVDSEDQRAKLKQWFFADVMNSVDRGRDDWQIIVIGTLLHESSLLSELRKDPSWLVVEVSICDENFNSNYPEFMSTEKVKALYAEYRANGQADVFAREYQNIPVSKEDAVFRQEYFRDYEPSTLLDIHDITFITICDPAKTVKLHSADSAVVTVGVDLEKHKIFFHDCVAGKMYPDELYDIMFEAVLSHGSRILGVEVTSLNEFITQPIRNEQMKRGVFCEFLELKARAKKEERIAQLAPFYRQGYVYHNPRVSQKLETQLLAFPKSALVDVSDAFAYIIEIMELDDKYFYGSVEPGMNEYQSLKAEPKRSENWRVV